MKAKRYIRGKQSQPQGRVGAAKSLRRSVTDEELSKAILYFHSLDKATLVALAFLICEEGWMKWCAKRYDKEQEAKQ